MKRTYLIVIALHLCLFSFSQTFKKTYKGKIGPYDVSVTLKSTDGSLTGTYYYTEFRDPISVKGFISGKHIEFKGLNLNGNSIDKFSGLIGKNDIHGIWISEDQILKYPFNFYEDRSLLPIILDSTRSWRLFIWVLVISLVVYLIRKYRKYVKVKIDKERIRSLANKLNPNFNTEQSFAFEQFMTGKLNDYDYKLVEWRSEKFYGRRNQHVPGKPVLEFERKKSNNSERIFYIECRYFDEYRDNLVHLGRKRKIHQFKHYSSTTNKPVFVAIGVGGQPSDPENLYLIPVENIHYEIINLKDIAHYKIQKSDLVYNPEDRSLRNV